MKKTIWFLVVVFWLVRLDGSALTTKNPLLGDYLSRSDHSNSSFFARDSVPSAAHAFSQRFSAQAVFVAQMRAGRPPAVPRDDDSAGSVAQAPVHDLVVPTRPPVQGTTDSSGDMNLHELFKSLSLPKERKNTLTQLLARENISKQLSAQDSNGSTPLHLAVLCDDSEALLRMVGAMSSRDSTIFYLKDNNGRTPFDLAVAYAVEQNNNAMVQAFYANRDFLDSVAGIDKTIVLKLVSSDAQGLDLNELFIRATNDFPYLSIPQRLLSLGANINAKDKDGRSVLHKTVFLVYPNKMRWVLAQQGVDVNTVDNNGDTPLHLVCSKQRYDSYSVIDELPPIMQKKDWSIPLDMMKMLIESGADVNACNQYKSSVLHQAAESGGLDRVKLLLDIPGINLDAVNNRGSTPLHVAGRFFCLELTKESISISAEYFEIIKVLISRGARVSIKNEAGVLPLDRALLVAAARRENLFDEIKYLVKKGANTDQLAFEVLRSGNTKKAEKILKKYELFHTVTTSGNNLLHIAASDRNVCLDMMRVLVELGVDPTAKNNEGLTPLDMIREYGCQKKCDYLWSIVRNRDTCSCSIQ